MDLKLIIKIFFSIFIFKIDNEDWRDKISDVIDPNFFIGYISIDFNRIYNKLARKKLTFGEEI